MPEVIPKKILVPIDLTVESLAALKEAAEVARFCKASLFVLYAEEALPQHESVAVSTATVRDMEAEQRATAQKYLTDQIAAIVPPSVMVESAIVLGEPVPSILKMVKDTNADWIVMATHGRTGLKRLALGSITEEVLRKTDKPLLAVHAAA